MDIGTALVASDDLALDFVAMKRCIRELGRPNTYFVPMTVKVETGVEARWRARTPDRFIAFGPDVTLMSVRELLGGAGALKWRDVAASGADHDEEAIPLFLVTAEGRCTIATEETLATTPATSKVLWVSPRD